MRRLILLVLAVFAGWYGWTHYRGLLERRPSHQAVIQNQGGAALERIRLKVDGQTLVKESLAPGEEAVLSFRVDRDASFQLTWIVGGDERAWAGGLVPAGPMLQRHVFTIQDGRDVMYRRENR